jgi:hypothetical protein
MEEKNEIIQAYFFNKNDFDDKKIIKFLIDNDLPTIQKISEHKFYYKIKLRSEKKLKLEGYNIIRKQYKEGIQINVAFKPPLINNFICKFA